MGFVLFVALKMKGMKGAIIMLANIIDNKPYCKKCGSIAGNGKEYRQVIDENGKQYTEFIKYCSNPKCMESVVYHVELGMEEHKRYALEDVILYKEEDTSNLYQKKDGE